MQNQTRSKDSEEKTLERVSSSKISYNGLFLTTLLYICKIPQGIGGTQTEKAY